MKENLIQDHRHDRLSDDERKNLLQLAREALSEGVQGKILKPLELEGLPDQLTRPGATFVTLTKENDLRGCIGSLEAKRPLVEDVRVHAVAAAMEDFRFPPVNEDEVDQILIEISRLTTPQPIEPKNEQDLLSQIRPGVDGVILKSGTRRATFLPQVWNKVPEVELFLEMLCRKMGSPPDCWREHDIQVFTYQVEKFRE
jgi:AmmeMemoRadiSam system protein A